MPTAYQLAVNGLPKPTKEEEREQSQLLESKQLADQSHHSWIMHPHTQRFIAFLKKKELDLMLSARESVVSHGTSESLAQNLIRSRTYKEIIDYAANGIA
jgi:hypothetical protein